MNIVYYSSDLFSEMCGVAIQSLCENNKDADDINIYVVEDNISDENKKRLNNIVQHFSRKIFFIKKPEQKDLYPDQCHRDNRIGLYPYPQPGNNQSLCLILLISVFSPLFFLRFRYSNKFFFILCLG